MIATASEGLEQFASAGVDFAVSTLILAVLAGSLTQSICDLGLRRLFHRWWVQAWLRKRGGSWAVWRQGTKGGRLYALPYPRLCGHLSSLLQFELDSPAHWVLLPNMVSPGTLEDLSNGNAETRPTVRQQVSAEMEEALDDLQTLLGNRSLIIYYLLSLLFSLSIVAVITVTENQFTQVEGMQGQLLAIGGIAGLMGPIFRHLIERLMGTT